MICHSGLALSETEKMKTLLPIAIGDTFVHIAALQKIFKVNFLVNNHNDKLIIEIPILEY